LFNQDYHVVSVINDLFSYFSII